LPTESIQNISRPNIITDHVCIITHQFMISHWTGSKLIHITLSSDLFVWDLISNPPIRTGLDFKSSHFDPVFGFASGLIKLRGLEMYSLGHLTLARIWLWLGFDSGSDLTRARIWLGWSSPQTQMYIAHEICFMSKWVQLVLLGFFQTSPQVTTKSCKRSKYDPGFRQEQEYEV
jgi:hypothetical protein